MAARGGVAAWLHGHRHDRYHHGAGALAPFPILCAGSATQAGRWSYSELTLESVGVGTPPNPWEGRLTVAPRTFDPDAGTFRDGGPPAVLDLPRPQRGCAMTFSSISGGR